MLNPFKKKENEFKLDEEKLPSLGTDTNLGNDVPSPDYSNPNSSTSQDFSSSSNNSFNSPGSDPFPQPSIAGGMGSIDTSSNQTQNNNLSNDIVKAKIESMESKMTLMEAKMSNIENKLEMIYQIILNEVSDETKKKIKVGKMMDTIKNN